MSEHTHAVNTPALEYLDLGVRLIAHTPEFVVDADRFLSALAAERVGQLPLGWLDPLSQHGSDAYAALDILKSFGFECYLISDEQVVIDGWVTKTYVHATLGHRSIWCALAAAVRPKCQVLFVLECCGRIWGDLIANNSYAQITYELHAVGVQ